MTKSLSSTIFDWGPWVFNLGLVIVGFLQVWLLRVTWKTIKLQTDIQGFGLRQWVDVGAWKLNGEEPRNDKGDLKESIGLQYVFLLSNLTSTSILLKRVQAQVISGTRCETFEISEERFLPPFLPSRESALLCLLPINIYGNEVERYEQSKFVFEIKGQIFFADGKGIAEPQPFRRTVKCGPSLEELYAYVGRNFKRIDAELREKNDSC